MGPNRRITDIKRESGYIGAVYNSYGGMSREEAVDIEKYLLEEFKDHKFKPEKWFSGHTECLKKECLPDLVLAIEERLNPAFV